MDLHEFLNKRAKTKVDFDGHFGAQCVDLFRQYCKDVLEIPHTGAVKGAKDLAEKYNALPSEKKYLDLITDKDGGEVGDAVIFGATDTNPYGHVAIVLGAIGDEEKKYLCFEQDGYAQTGTKFALHTHENVIGFLRKKI